MTATSLLSKVEAREHKGQRAKAVNSIKYLKQLGKYDTLPNREASMPYKVVYNEAEEDTKDPAIAEFLGLYDGSWKKEVKKWLDHVTQAAAKLMADHPSQIHSIRSRLKETTHLGHKLERKIHAWRKESDDNFGRDTFFDYVEDLAGVRILVLYRSDIAIVDHLIRRSGKWKIRKAEANYLESRISDKNYFESLGLKAKASNRGYSSVHYILTSSKEDAPESHVCELQLRTVSQELWGEFDHQLKYPHNNIDTLPSDIVTRLSELIHLTGDLMDTVRKNPIDAKLFRVLWGEVLEREGVVIPRCLKKIAEAIEKSHENVRTGPLKIIEVLTSDDFKNGRVQSVVSLDFGSPREWTMKDELRDLYLEAHSWWANSSDRERSVEKYFVWNASEDLQNIDPVKPFSRHKEVKCFWIDEAIFNIVHEKIGRELKTDYLARKGWLKSVQFFGWSTSRANREKFEGFFSPASDPSLITGTIRLDSSSLSEFVPYVNILRDLKECGGARSIDDREVPDHQEIEPLIEAIVKKHFSVERG